MTRITEPRLTRGVTSDTVRSRAMDSDTSARPEKKHIVLGYIWLKLLLTTGLLLGLLLLVQSAATYYQVTRILVMEELRKEAQHYVLAIERESRRMRVRNPAELGPFLDEIRQEAQDKIAWVRVTDMTGHVLANSGESVGAPFTPERLRPALEELVPVSQVRRTEAGEVLVTALPLRGIRAPLQADGRATGRGPDGVWSPRFVEIALYFDSVAGTFGRLRTNLIVSSSAALALVASVILLWLRLPHYVRGKQLERQTEIARQVQMDLLPAADAVFEDLDFAAVCISAEQVGGDFYDVFADNCGRTAIVVGDVSGKGLPASVVAGLLVGAVRASGWTAGATEHEESSIRISELLRTRTSPERFASMFWCYYEPELKVLRYVNAGHLPPFLIRRVNGSKLEVHRLTEGGPVLGLLQGIKYRQGRAAVFAGDLLVMFSDGVVEAMSSAGELFDEDRLIAVIRENLAASPAEMRAAIFNRVIAFLSKEQAQDDLTLVVIRFGALNNV